MLSMRRRVTVVIFALGICHASNSSNEGATYDQRQQGDLNVHVHLSDIGLLAFLDESIHGTYEDYEYNYEYEIPQDEYDNVSLTSSTASSAVTTSNTSTTAEPSTNYISEDESIPTTTQPSTEDAETNSTSSGTNSTTESDSSSTITTPNPTTKHKSTVTSTTKTTSKPKPTTTTTPKPSTTPKPKPPTTKPKPSTTTAKPGQKNQTISSTLSTVKETSSELSVSEGSTRVPEETPTTHKSLLAMLLPGAQAPQQGDKKHGTRRRCGPGFYRDSRGRCRRIRKPNYQMLERLPIQLPFGIRIAPRPVAGQEESAHYNTNES